MPQYVKIEWSGYWDFPDANYSGGSKDGVPITGQFNPKYIRLGDAGAIEYEIDPGEISLPSSNDWEFTLENRHEATGDQIYPFEEIINIGRTEEYGGSFAHFGDLFIRVSIPVFDNKTVFKGVANELSYSPHNFTTTIKCKQIIDVFKDSQQNMFVNHDFGSCDVTGIDNGSTSGYAQSIANTDSVVSPRGFDMGFERLLIEVEDTENKDLIDVQALIDSGKWPTARTPGGSLLGHHLDYWQSNNDNITTINNFLTDPQVKPMILGEFENDLFVDRYVSGLDIKVAFTDGTSAFVGRILSDWFNAFLKVEDSTIFTQFRIQYDIRIETSSSVDGSVNLAPDAITINRYSIQLIHANNPKVESTIGQGKDKNVYERGRFFKDGDTYEDSKIKEGDEVSLNIIDYNRGDSFRVNESNNRCIAHKTFADREDRQQLNRHIVYPIHGAIFEVSEGVLQPNTEEGYFDNVNSLVNELESNFISKYVYRHHSRDHDRLAFDISALDDNKNRYCFYPDVVHYGWNDNLEDIIVNTGRQVSAYLFSGENGKIKMSPRKRSDYSNVSDLLDEAIQIHQEDYSIDSGFNYSYGSKYYRTTFTDRIEINNVEGEEEIEFIVNSEGEVTNTVQKTQEIEVSNYRTTDLAIPSTQARTGSKQERRLRSRPNNLDHFLNTPVNQAITLADGINYPSELFTIGLDILGGRENYKEISIGSIVYIIRDGEDHIYLVKKINYSPSRIRDNSLSVKMDLLKLFVYHDPVRESFDESIEVSDSHSDDVKSESYLEPPSNLSASASGCVVSVNWADRADSNIDHYEVQFRSNQSGWTDAGTVPNPSPSPSFQDDISSRPSVNGISVDYDYRARSVDSDGNTGGWSVPSNIVTVDTTNC